MEFINKEQFEFYLRIILSSKIHKDLIYAAFFFIDIVGLSKPNLSTETQQNKIKKLNEIIFTCKIFQDTKKEDPLILPTGDGLLIGFPNGLEEPLKLAIEFHEKLSQYNKKSTKVENIETRIGCHVGHVFVVKDVLGNTNLWGPGAIIARRIMDMGDSNHILLSNELANDLLELSKEYEKILNPLHNFGIKHGDNLLIYSAYGKDFGNPELPKEKIKIEQKISDSNYDIACKKITFNLILRDGGKSARIEQYYNFSNSFSDPIYEILISIITNSEEEFQNINPIVYDENDKELEISKILALSPISKKFVVKLAKPIFYQDSGRMIKIIYNVNLIKNNFESFFSMNSSHFELNFSHYSNEKYLPILHHVNSENHSKTMITMSSPVIKGMFTTIKWEENQGVDSKDIIRLEW